MRDVQRIAIVDPFDATREELRNVLLGLESIWLEAESPRYEFFPDVIKQSQPDVVVISLDSDQAILQALRCGAREFLTAPVVLEELLKALQRLQRTRGGESRQGGEAVPKV